MSDLSDLTRVTYRGVQLDRMRRGSRFVWAPARTNHTYTVWQWRASDVLQPGGDECMGTGVRLY